MNVYAITSLIAFIISFCLALFVYLKGNHDKHSRAITPIILCAGIWCLFPFLASIGGKENALFFTRIVYIAAVFTAPSFLNFGLTILGFEKQPREKMLIWISLAISFLFFLPFLFSPFFIKDIRMVNSYVSIVGGPVYFLFILFFGVVCGYCFYKLYKALLIAGSFRRNQLKYVFFCFLFAFASGLIHFSTSFNVPEVFPHDLLVIACMIFLIYSILRYRLMDIGVAITRTGLFVAVYTLVLGLPFALAARFRGDLIAVIGANWWTVPLGLMAVLATVGPFIYIYLQAKAEGTLLKEQKRYQQTLKQASVGMTRIRNLNKLLALITHIVTKTVKISYVAIYLYNKESNDFVLQISRDKGRISLPKIAKDNPLISWLSLKRDPVVYEELKRQIEDSQDNTLKLLEENMRILTASVVIPSLLEDKLMGLIVLGDKMSGQIYTPEDLSVFQVLASQAALAIENAQFYEEAKDMQGQIAHAEKMATIGTMADGLSHQINNRFYALSLIAGDTIDTIKTTDTNNCTPEVKEMLGQINHALERIQTNVVQGGEVVKGILKYTRKGEEGFEPLAMDDILDNTLEMVQYKVKLSDVDIIRDYPKDGPKIKGNMVQLQEVFFNFIDNAYDAIVERKVTLNETGYRGRITVLVKPKENNLLEIVVEDNGMGIRDQNNTKIFTPFFTTKTSSRRGTGLGLYVIEKIITEAHKGKISFESQHKTGTRFILELGMA